MPYESRPNQCLLFKNKYKQAGDKKPDFRSSVPVEINGIPTEVALWVGKDRNGLTFFSLRFSEPRGQQQTKVDPDDLPF